LGADSDEMGNTIMTRERENAIKVSTEIKNRRAENEEGFWSITKDYVRETKVAYC